MSKTMLVLGLGFFTRSLTVNSILALQQECYDFSLLICNFFCESTLFFIYLDGYFHLSGTLFIHFNQSYLSALLELRILKTKYNSTVR